MPSRPSIRADLTLSDANVSPFSEPGTPGARLAAATGAAARVALSFSLLARIQLPLLRLMSARNNRRNQRRVLGGGIAFISSRFHLCTVGIFALNRHSRALSDPQLSLSLQATGKQAGVLSGIDQKERFLPSKLPTVMSERNFDGEPEAETDTIDADDIEADTGGKGVKNSSLP